MAERRMFAKSVVNSARFLRMPQSSRLLYYDLGMAADDDGIVEAFAVLRTTASAEEDLRILASRGFVTVLNEELVTYITDWKQNNQIRPDRYHASIYADLLIGAGDSDRQNDGGKPMVNQRCTEVRLGEDSSENDRESLGDNSSVQKREETVSNRGLIKSEDCKGKLDFSEGLTYIPMTAEQESKTRDYWTSAVRDYSRRNTTSRGQ